MSVESRRPGSGVEIALLLSLGLLWLFLAEMSSAYALKHFQERDILRAERLLSGRPELLGPESNAGTRLPGPFYSLLLAAPVALGGWVAVTHFLSLFYAASITLLALLLRRRIGFAAALASSILLALNPLLFAELIKNWNPSFALCWLFLSVMAGLGAQSRRPGRLAVWGASLSLGLQLHGNFLPLFLPSLWLLAERKEERLRALLCFLGGALLPLLPALLFLRPAGGAGADGAPGSYFLQLLLYRQGGPGPRVFYQFLLPLLLQLPLLWLTKGGAGGPAPERRFFLVHALFLLPVAFVFLWTAYGERYSLPFLVFTTLWLASGWKELGPRALQWCLLGALLLLSLRLPGPRPGWLRDLLSPGWLHPLLAIAGAAGIAALPDVRRRLAPASLAALWGLAPILIPGAPAPLRNPNIEELRAVVRWVIERTGWSYLDFRWRALAIGIRGDTGLQLIYESELKRSAGRRGTGPAAGVLLIANTGLRSDNEEILRHLRERLPGLFGRIRTGPEDMFCTRSAEREMMSGS